MTLIESVDLSQDRDEGTVARKAPNTPLMANNGRGSKSLDINLSVDDGHNSLRPESDSDSSPQEEATEDVATSFTACHKVPEEKVGRDNFITSFRRKCREDPVYWANLKDSICLATALFALGVAESQGGPTFLDLQIITNTTVGQASAFFTSHSFGCLLGSALSGNISGRRINASLVLLIGMLAMGASGILVPHCSLYGAMIFMRGFQGVCAGAVDTTANAENMRIWGKEGRVLMQLLHFAFSLGGVVSPLVTEPFLAEQPRRNQTNLATSTYPSNLTLAKYGGYNNTSNIDLSSNHSFGGSSNSVQEVHVLPLTWNISFSNESTIIRNKSLAFDISLQNLVIDTNAPTTNVHWAFLITGTIVILSSTPFFFLYQKSRRLNKATSVKNQDMHKEAEGSSKSSEMPAKYRKLPLHYYVIIFVGISLFYMLYCSVEDTFAAFLMTFVVRRFSRVSKSDGAHITAIFWASFSASRFLMIFVSRVLSPVRVILLEGSISLLAFVGFAVSSGPWIGGHGGDGGSISALTFFSVMAGLGLSGVFPAGISWIGEELVLVTGRVSSCIFVSAALGAMLNPLLVSRLMEDVSNMWFCYLLVLEVSIISLVFCSLLAFNRCWVVPRHGHLHLSCQENVEVTRCLDGDTEGAQDKQEHAL